MSSALPAGGPSKISVITTSASSMSTMRCAVVDPTNPLPTTVTFFLLIRSSPNLCVQLLCAPRPKIVIPSEARNLLLFFRSSHYSLSRDGRRRLHILNNRISKRRRAHFGRSGHQPLQIVRHAFLLNG